MQDEKPIPQRPSYLLAEVARLARVSLSTVKRDVRAGRLLTVKVRRSRRVLHADLVVWLGRDPFQ